jgi:hypothetical protein
MTESRQSAAWRTRNNWCGCLGLSLDGWLLYDGSHMPNRKIEKFEFIYLERQHPAILTGFQFLAKNGVRASASVSAIGPRLRLSIHLPTRSLGRTTTTTLTSITTRSLTSTFQTRTHVVRTGAGTTSQRPGCWKRGLQVQQGSDSPMPPRSEPGR